MKEIATKIAQFGAASEICLDFLSKDQMFILENANKYIFSNDYFVKFFLFYIGKETTLAYFTTHDFLPTTVSLTRQSADVHSK